MARDPILSCQYVCANGAERQTILSAEINIFLGEGVGHIKYIVEDPVGYDESGNPQPQPIDPTYLVETYKQLCAYAVEQGITLGKDPPRSYGNRAPAGPKAETPSPSDIEPPMHCGEPCEYKEAWVNRKTGKTINPKFQCRNANCPDKALTGYPWSVFEDRWRKAQQP